MKKKVAVAAMAVLGIVTGVVYALVPARVIPDSVAVFKTSGMTCGSCAGKIEDALKREKGVAKVEVDLEGGRVFAAMNSRQVKAADLAEKVTASGFRSSVAALVTVEEFRRVIGRDVGQKMANNGGCGCCNKKQ